MSAAKKKKTSSSFVSAWLRRLLSWLWGPGRLVFTLAVLLGLLLGGTYATWRWLKPRILGSPEYRVSAEQVEITPPPPWIHRDIRAEVFRDPTLDGPLSIMDDDLAERISKAFSRHPWVAGVGPVTKRHPASITVELKYRRPVCMVEVPGGLLPVDAEGTLLPSGDFSPSEAARYPRLAGVDREPTGPAGSRWGDAKVIGGAEIATAFGPAWTAMNLQRIVPLGSDTALGNASPRQSSEPVFMLLTRGNTSIRWGYAPGANAIGEVSAVEKVARLQRYFNKHDSLDGRQGHRQELDVRTLPPSVSP